MSEDADRGCFGDKMGGKKKKSAAAQAATSGAPPAAAAGRSGSVATEEANKRLNGDKWTKPAKENKSKGDISLLASV